MAKASRARLAPQLPAQTVPPRTRDLHPHDLSREFRRSLEVGALKIGRAAEEFAGGLACAFDEDIQRLPDEGAVEGGLLIVEKLL